MRCRLGIVEDVSAYNVLKPTVVTESDMSVRK